MAAFNPSGITSPSQLPPGVQLGPGSQHPVGSVTGLSWGDDPGIFKQGGSEAYFKEIAEYFGRPLANDLTTHWDQRRHTPVFSDAWRRMLGEHVVKVVFEGARAEPNYAILNYVPLKPAQFGPITIETQIFDDARLDERTELGTSRYSTYSWRKRTHTLKQFGRATFLEGGLSLTEQGKRTYSNYITQLKYGVANTLVLQALFALLTAAQHVPSVGLSRSNIAEWRRWGFAHDGSDLVKVLRMERLFFGALNKLSDPTERILSAAKEQIALQGGEDPNTVFVSVGTREAVRFRDDLYEYSKVGPAIAAEKRASGEMPPAVSRSGLGMFEVRPMSLEENGRIGDPLCRPRSVGEFWTMGGIPTTLDPATYKSEYNTRWAMNWKSDRIEAISYLDAVGHSGIWNNEGKLSDLIGKPYFLSSGVQTLGQWVLKTAGAERHAALVRNVASLVGGGKPIADANAFYALGGAAGLGELYGYSDAGARDAARIHAESGKKVFAAEPSDATDEGKFVDPADGKVAAESGVRRSVIAAIQNFRDTLNSSLPSSFGDLFELYVNVYRRLIEVGSNNGKNVIETLTEGGLTFANDHKQTLLVVLLAGAQQEGANLNKARNTLRLLGRGLSSVGAWLEGAKFDKDGSKGAKALAAMNADDADLGNIANTLVTDVLTGQEGKDTGSSNAEKILNAMSLANITFLWYKQWILKGGFPFIRLAVVRPEIVMMTQCWIIFKAGAETVYVAIGQPDFQVAYDVRQKYMEGHLTLAAAGIPVKPENIFVFDNVRVREFVCGHGTSFYDPNDPHSLSVYRQGGGQLSEIRDLIAIPLLPGEFLECPEMFDLTGQAHPGLGHTGIFGRTPHYHMAPAMRAVWGWAHAPGVYGTSTFFDDTQPRNTIVCRAWHAGSIGTTLFAERGAGHLPPVPYTGCAAAFVGQAATNGVQEKSLAEIMGAAMMYGQATMA